MRSCFAATALFITAGPVVAADLPPEPPIFIPPPIVEEASCLYVRVDGGYAWNEAPDVKKNLSAAVDEEIDDTWFAEAGVGCQVTPYFRADITVGYRADSEITTKWNDLDAEFEAYTAMVSAYWDIWNFNGVTPYVGVGVGVSNNRLHNISLPAGNRNNSRVDFAYQLMAGVSVDLTDQLTLDAGYRYIDLGSAKAKGADPIRAKDLESHDVRVGLRYNFY